MCLLQLVSSIPRLRDCGTSLAYSCKFSFSPPWGEIQKVSSEEPNINLGAAPPVARILNCPSNHILRRKQEARLAEDIKAFQQRMNTSATLVQPHAVFKGGPDRDIGLREGPNRGNAFRGGPLYHGVGLKRRPDRGIGDRGGPKRAASVSTWRTADERHSNFPSRPIESGANPVEGGIRKGTRPRPSTAGGDSSIRRHMQNIHYVPTENVRLLMKEGLNRRVGGATTGIGAHSGPRESTNPSAPFGVTPVEEGIPKGRRPRPSSAGGALSRRRQVKNVVKY